MIGRVIGPYEVIEAIGKGGMGEVFRARDTKLNRDVALKILPPELGGDAERLARFERESRVLASLQHQNIAAIYGVEEVDGQPVLVMELAEGHDLSLRLGQGSLPPSEIEKIALQLATGLEFAHEKGIVHRDLKPANVKVAGDGRVKILDFGLARAFSSDGAKDSTSGSASYQPTLTQALTGAGTILGTAAYMSPEQARGYDVDRRSDIWAFGVILYEMMTGKSLFAGDTATDTLAAVIHKEADWEVIPEGISPLLVQIGQRCLIKDPQHRLRDIGEARVALEGVGSSVLGLSVDNMPALAMAPPQARRSNLPWLLTGVLALCTAAVGYLGLTGIIGPKPATERIVKATISLPENLRLDLNPASPGPVAVSPDGRQLAFSASDSGGTTNLYVRDLDNNKVKLINNSKTSAYHFWSPDSRSLAFFTDAGSLERAEVGGGPVINITPADNGKGGSWGEDNTLIFAPNHISSIHRVSADGGEAFQITDLKADVGVRSHRFPQWLPGGKYFLYIAVQRSAERVNSTIDSILRLASIDGSVSKDLMPCQNSVSYAAGHLLFVHDNILMARPFDMESLDFSGPAQPLEEGVLTIPAAHLAVMSASSAGVLAYSSGAGGGFGNSQLVRMNRSGSDEKKLGDPMMTFGLSISPQGSHLALSFPDQKNGTFDIWLMELERELKTRLTFETEAELQPVWSADGQWIVYSSDVGGTNNLYRKAVVGGGMAESLHPTPSDCYPSDWSADGSLIAFTESDTAGTTGVGLLAVETLEVVRRITGPTYSIFAATFSPDQRWLTYVSTETGAQEIFVEAVEPGGGRWRVSANGGSFPRWSSLGDRLYYLTPNGELAASEVVAAGGGLGFGQVLNLTGGINLGTAHPYVEDKISGDLIVLKSASNRENSTLHLVTGWLGLLDNNRD